MIPKKIMLFSVIISICVLSCSREAKDESPVIAQVGSKELTLNELENYLPTDSTLELSQVQIEQFVQRWIESELVYQEALSQDFDKDPEIQKELYRVQKDLIVSTFLEQLLKGQQAVTEQEIEEYYEQKSEDFIRTLDFYHLNLIVLESLREANRVRNEIDKGLEFARAAQQYSMDASKQKGGDLGWVAFQELPESIAKALPSLKEGVLSRPIKGEIGYSLVLLIGIRKKGEIQTLEEARPLIVWNLKQRKRENAYRKLIALVGEKVNMQTNWDVIQNLVVDSSQPNAR
jgi:peptidyl-prolyl cis-trans isomerase C